MKKEKKLENINPKVLKPSNGKSMLLSNVPYVVVKNENILKNKKQVKY